MIRMRSDTLVDFRTEHPCKEVVVDDVRWVYIACGKRDHALLLNGGLRVAEIAFAYIELLEPRYRVCSVSEPVRQKSGVE
jgi:hypothetical protein